MAFEGCQGVQPGITGATGIQSINHIIFRFKRIDRSITTSVKPPFDELPANASNPSYNGTSIVSVYHLATVSDTVADYTVILAFIEKRFGIPPLTKRNAAQMDLAEFFYFEKSLGLLLRLH